MQGVLPRIAPAAILLWGIGDFDAKGWTSPHLGDSSVMAGETRFSEGTLLLAQSPAMRVPSKAAVLATTRRTKTRFEVVRQVNDEWQFAIWNDINYVARMRLLEDGRAEFEAFRIFRFEESGRVMYNPGDYETSSDPVSDLEAAQRFVSGEIGVDGWSSIHFNEQERTPLFFSSKGEAASIGLLIARIYDLAHGLIASPKW